MSFILKKAHTFNDFNKLIFKGQLQLLTLTDYIKKPNTTRHNRKVIITQFYKKIQ